MAKHEIIEDTRAPSGEAEASGASATEPRASKTPNMASADAGEGAASNEAGALESATNTAPQADSSGRPDTVRIAPDIDQLKMPRGGDTANAEEALPGVGEGTPRVSRFALLA
ncbi:MAG TPA: hypothetical protein VE667_12520, partial [Xanthobacteraceae bacterium]|nr:hypothetical protein [Xanthobacteraceae bacterium]